MDNHESRYLTYVKNTIGENNIIIFAFLILVYSIALLCVLVSSATWNVAAEPVKDTKLFTNQQNIKLHTRFAP